MIRAIFESYAYVSDLIEHKNTSLARLRSLLFGSATEKTADVLGRTRAASPAAAHDQSAGVAASTTAATPENSGEPHTDSRTGKKGHGRNGAADYPGAKRVPVRHGSLEPGMGVPTANTALCIR